MIGRKIATARSRVFALACCAAVGGCGTPGDAAGPLDHALQAAGLATPHEVSGVIPGSQPAAPRTLVLRLHAGEILNTGIDGRSLSVVARIYKLRDPAAFEAAPYTDFQDSASGGHPAFSADVVDVREVVFTPGRRYEAVEPLAADVRYVAVVGLFRSPAPDRWRFVFDVRPAAPAKITMGIHGCALSVSTGNTLDIPSELRRVAGVNCPDQGP